MADAAATTPSRDRRGHFRAKEPAVLESSDTLEAVTPEPPEDDAPEFQEPSEDEEAEGSEIPATAELVPAQPSRAAMARVQAMLQEALRLGEQFDLVRTLPDGTLEIAGQTRRPVRESSDCTCQQCSPYAQQHWWCMVCNSGPHDWLMVKPQHERQVLLPGGIEGRRHACCSMRCAQTYLQTLGRQPSGMSPTQERTLDPTLGIPGP